MKVLKCLPKEPLTFVHWTPDVSVDEVAAWLGSLDTVEFTKTGMTFDGKDYVRFRTTLDVTDAVYPGNVIVLDVDGYPSPWTYRSFALDFQEVTHEWD